MSEEQKAPERIWLDADAEAGDGKFERCFENPKYCSEPPVEYIRFDLAQPPLSNDAQHGDGALDEAYRKGQEDMREMAAKVFDEWLICAMDGSDMADEVQTAIRALPIQGGDDAA